MPRRRDRRPSPEIRESVEPVPLPEPCPDCGAVADQQRQIRHQDACPFARALDDVVDGDREYFKTHPAADQRRRPPTMGEMLNMMWVERKSLPEPPPRHHWEATGIVTVTQCAPGFRTRDYSEACFVAMANAESH
jgi:hypothetical protein